MTAEKGKLMPAVPAFGLNRFNYTSPSAFAADAQRAEALGWDYSFIPSSPLRRQDPYVHLAFAATQTERIGLGPLIENPVMRHPSVMASSIATVEALAPGRTILAYGVGDTAVRLMGKRPATVAELEAATVMTRRLLAGEELEVNAARPACLEHAMLVPVWIRRRWATHPAHGRTSSRRCVYSGWPTRSQSTHFGRGGTGRCSRSRPQPGRSEDRHYLAHDYD